MSVNPVGQFIFKNADISDNDLLNYLMGNLITGYGPENYVFPTDGYVSKRAAEGMTFRAALKRWYAANEDAIKNRAYDRLRKFDEVKVDYLGPEQLGDIVRDGSPFTIPNFIGSAWATIEVLNKDKIKITIFNVTSITSGDLLKHGRKWPVSVKRHRGQTIPYGSISTTFSVTRAIDYKYFVNK